MLEEKAFHIRHGTQDQEVFDAVFVNNQYQLPEKLPADSVIIDVGANIGAFAAACLARGAGTVVCFEPCPLNYVQLSMNMQIWPDKAPCFNVAVWTSDKMEKVKFVNPGSNTACGAVTRQTTPISGTDVVCMGIDEIIDHITDGGEIRINIMKIDAEGSEYPILYTSKNLHLVDQILLETHEYPKEHQGEKFFVDGFPDDEACADGMEKFLVKSGFSVVRKPESEGNDINTLFFASRSNNDAS